MEEDRMDADWVMRTEPNGLNINGNWTNTNITEGDMGLNSSEKFDPTVIYWENPEEMLNPSRRNPIFYHIIVTHVVTFIVGIVGNLVAVFVMIGDRKSRNATNLFLVSLAVADLLLLLLCVPLEVLQYFLQFDGNEFICKMAKYVLLLSASASVLNLCAVSLERFIVIVFPMRSRSLCTLSNCRKAILLVWIVATVLSLPVMLIKDGYTMTYTNYQVSVKVYYCETADENLPFAIYQFVILFAAPGFLMMICYIYVIRELYRSTMDLEAMTNSRYKAGRSTRNINLLSNSKSFRTNNRSKKENRNSSDEKEDHVSNNSTSRFLKDKRSGVKPEPEKATKYQKSENASAHSVARRSVNHIRASRGDDVKKARKQVIKMLILVILLFLICWGPKLIMTITLKLAETFGLEVYTQSMYNTRVIFSLIPFIHSSFNPVIYSFMSKNFRRSMSRQLIRLSTVCGCNCVKTGPTRNDIPLRSAINRARKPYGPDSTFSSNYYSVSEAASTRNTEVHGISTI